MLISMPSLLAVPTDPMLKMLTEFHNLPPSVEIIPGIYQINSFGGTYILSDFERYPTLDIGPYGVCDSYEQILEQCPELVDSTDREFVITLTPVVKADQPAEGGWRWHKWGDYIGNLDPQYEYIYDEPFIEKVYCYHIYELVK